MRTITSQSASAEPDEPYATPVSSVKARPLEEGSNYFRLQFKFGDNWGSVQTYPIQVDLSDPSYIIVKEAEREDESDPRVGFAIEASDELSGIAHYEIAVDGGTPEKWERPVSGVYRPVALDPGEHVLTVYAYDRAGNGTSTDFIFMVQSLEPPILDDTSVDGRFLVGDAITIRGTTYPNADVTVYHSLNDGEANEKQVRSDDTGLFIATVTDGARPGKYTLWFSVTDERGASSPPSIKRSVNVSQPLIMLFGGVAVTYLSIIVPLIALIFLLVLVLWLGYTWARSYRSRVQYETKDAYRAARKEFDALRKDLIKQIGMLERANQSRELTREEMRIFTNLSKRLDHIERHIAEEIEDIEHIDETPQEPAVRQRTVAGALERYKKALAHGEELAIQQHQGEQIASQAATGHTVHIQPKRVE
jgi:hypothetical protein